MTETISIKMAVIRIVKLKLTTSEITLSVLRIDTTNEVMELEMQGRSAMTKMVWILMDVLQTVR